MSELQIFLTIVVLTIGTLLTRFIPFLLFRDEASTPPIIAFLGEALPFAVMAMLVVYCMKHVSFSSASTFLPETIAVVVIIFLHRWKKNTLLSIAGGTALYMFLVQVIFI